MKTRENFWLILIILLLAGNIFLLSDLLSNRRSEPAFNRIIYSDPFPDMGFENPENETGEILKVEDVTPEPSFPVSLAYDKYLTTYTYLFVEGQTADIRSEPSTEATLLRQAEYGERLNYLESVYIAASGDEARLWYHVYWGENGENSFGFIENSGITERRFQFDKMENAIRKAEDYDKRGKLVCIGNYQNLNGDAPLYKGSTVDEEGNRRSQSAPGYIDIDDKNKFVYIEDGTLVLYQDTLGSYTKIEKIANGETYYVPSKYIPKGLMIHDLKKIIVIDVTNQNEGVYEKIADEWTLISYSHATTGKVGQYSQPTSLGFFFAMDSRPYFRYYEDGTTRIQGYAPYAVRFAGGAYIHGIPVNYQYAVDGSLITA